MKPWIAILLAGWMAWVDTTHWDDVDAWGEDRPKVQTSTKSSAAFNESAGEEGRLPRAGHRSGRQHHLLYPPPEAAYGLVQSRRYSSPRTNGIEDGTGTAARGEVNGTLQPADPLKRRIMQ